MESFGMSRLSARGQLTVTRELRTLYGLREGDVFEWFGVSREELGRLPDKPLLLVIPKRAQVLSPLVEQELRETSEAGALTLSDFQKELTVREKT